MPKPKCPDCDGLGMIMRGRNRWCHCPAGQEYVTELNRAREQMGAKPMHKARQKPKPITH